MNKIDGRRISAAEAWLTPDVRARDNLQILANTTAVELVWSGSRVTGARLQTAQEDPVEHRADRVLVACGALNTPRLLLASGLGPEAELKRLGVPVRVDLPGVGARLLDHPGFAMFFRPRKAGVRVPGGHLIQTVLRCSSGLGPWANDLQLQVGTFVPLARMGLPFVSLMGTLGKVHGCGTLSWPNLKPATRPVVENRFFEDPEDHARAAVCMEIGRELAATPEMSALARHLWPSRRRLSTRERIQAWVPRATNSGYHPCGTVPMGAESDALAVCDGQGRVRGVQGLHVVDASLFPTIPTGNIHLTVLMAAEHLAEMLRDEAATAREA
jgi:choline dehydrogenase